MPEIAMSTFDKYRLNNYSIMDAPIDVLDQFFGDATREELIEWLVWNDRNGIYRDDEHMSEFDRIMTKEDGIENMRNQILSSRE